MRWPRHTLMTWNPINHLNTVGLLWVARWLKGVPRCPNSQMSLGLTSHLDRALHYIMDYLSLCTEVTLIYSRFWMWAQQLHRQSVNRRSRKHISKVQWRQTFENIFTHELYNCCYPENNLNCWRFRTKKLFYVQQINSCHLSVCRDHWKPSMCHFFELCFINFMILLN